MDDRPHAGRVAVHRVAGGRDIPSAGCEWIRKSAGFLQAVDQHGIGFVAVSDDLFAGPPHANHRLHTPAGSVDFDRREGGAGSSQSASRSYHTTQRHDDAGD